MNKKVLLMLSGGLDSTLALKLLQDDGYEVEAINFKTIFCRCSKNGCKNEAQKVTERTGVKLHVYNLMNEFLPIVFDPPHGYGSNMNPCIDCRILMYKKAREMMKEINADFLATGEVIGQRPMSQNLRAIDLIEKEADAKGKVIRPLSSIGIYGRSRKMQIKLAEEKGIKDYPCPAGGCLLTDPGFAKRLKDLIKYKKKEEINIMDVMLLKTGRHFRVSEQLKIIVGRNEEENKKLSNLVSANDILLEVDGYVGPVGLIRDCVVCNGDTEISASIVARYSDAPNKNDIRVNIKKSDTVSNILVSKINEERLRELII